MKYINKIYNFIPHVKLFEINWCTIKKKVSIYLF